MDEFENIPEQPEQTPSYDYYSYTPPTPQPPTEPVKVKKDRTGLKITALALCFSLLGGCIGAGGALRAQKSREVRHHRHAYLREGEWRGRTRSRRRGNREQGTGNRNCA